MSSLIESLEPFRDSTNWFSHWRRGHAKHGQAFPDGPFVAGLAYSGLILLDKATTQDKIDFSLGYMRRQKNGIPAEMVRDPRMTGKPHELMLNRDQWSAIIVPTDAFWGLSNYVEWREYAKFRPRHWLFPNHALFFERVIGEPSWFQTILGDQFEYFGIKLHGPGNEDTTIHITLRLAWAILQGYKTRTVIKSWCELRRRVNIKADFTEFATRPIPGDPPTDDHPRFDLIWHKVIDLVNQEIGNA